MSYIDGFVAAVPTANREKYKKHAADSATVFKDHGAVKVVELGRRRSRREGDVVPDGG